MKRSRRSFLKIAGISALSLGAKPILDGVAASLPSAKRPNRKCNANRKR
jgi:hypothetical protein